MAEFSFESGCCWSLSFLPRIPPSIEPTVCDPCLKSYSSFDWPRDWLIFCTSCNTDAGASVILGDIQLDYELTTVIQSVRRSLRFRGVLLAYCDNEFTAELFREEVLSSSFMKALPSFKELESPVSFIKLLLRLTASGTFCPLLIKLRSAFMMPDWLLLNRSLL